MFLEDNKIPLSMLRLSFLKKSRFTGSYNKKRYIFETEFEKIINDKNKEENIPKNILLHIYPDKFCYELTDKKDIETKTYPFSKNGIDEGLKYLCEVLDK